MNKRVIYLDYVRVLACFLVILIHSPMHDGVHSSIWLSVYNYFSAPCIGLFFMVSGALLLPIKYNTVNFLKKRIYRILFPLVFWSLFYLCLKLCLGKINLNEVPNILVKSLYSSSIEGVLWFLYALIGLYLFFPIISAWVSSAKKNDYRYFLFFWVCTLFLPYLGIETYLLSSFVGYLGYMVLGVYISKYPINNNFIIICCIFISVIFPLLGYLKMIKVDNCVIYNYLNINVMSLCVIYFTICQRYLKVQSKYIISISTMSFGIYLLHIFIMRYFVWEVFSYIGRINYLLEIPLVAVTTFILSFLIIKVLSLFRFSRYMIGL